MSDEPRPDDQPQDTAATQGDAATAVETPPAEEKASKLTQSVEMKDVGPCKKHVKVTVERKAIDERLKEKFSDLIKKSYVPGFRPGKAPSRLVEKRYGSEVGDQVKTEVLLASLEQLADETDLAPLSPPNIDPEKIEMPKDGPFVYEFEVEVRPEFDLPEYKGLKLKRPVYTFTDEDVAREEKRILMPDGQVVPKPEGNAQIDDVLVADLTFKDGETVINEAKEVQIRVQKQLVLNDALAKDFEDKVRGANAGDTRTVDLELSSQSANPNLRGKTIQMVIAIKEVKSIRLPEMTDEYLSKFGVHTAESFRELVKVVLDRKLEFEQRQSARRQVAEYISSKADWKLPEDLLVRQARRAMARRQMEMQSEGIPESEIANRMRLLQQDILRSTEVSLKEHFVLQKIAETEKIEVNDDDLENEIERMAEQSGESARRIRARLEKEDMMEAVAAEMIERKALDLILDSATYEDVTLGEELKEGVATVEEQVVPGEMRDVAAEAAAQQTESQGEAPQS